MAELDRVDRALEEARADLPAAATLDVLRARLGLPPEGPAPSPSPSPGSSSSPPARGDLGSVLGIGAGVFFVVVVAVALLVSHFSPRPGVYCGRSVRPCREARCRIYPIPAGNRAHPWK